MSKRAKKIVKVEMELKVFQVKQLIGLMRQQLKKMENYALHQMQKKGTLEIHPVQKRKQQGYKSLISQLEKAISQV